MNCEAWVQGLNVVSDRKPHSRLEFSTENVCGTMHELGRNREAVSTRSSLEKALRGRR